MRTAPEQAREMRRIARYQLAGIYGSAGVLSGVAGMPHMGYIYAVQHVV